MVSAFMANLAGTSEYCTCEHHSRRPHGRQRGGFVGRVAAVARRLSSHRVPCTCGRCRGILIDLGVGLPKKPLLEFRRFDGRRRGQVLRRVKLGPVAVVAKPAHGRHEVGQSGSSLIGSGGFHGREHSKQPRNRPSPQRPIMSLMSGSGAPATSAFSRAKSPSSPPNHPCLVVFPPGQCGP
jgi:hypothetical protein